MTNCRVLMTTDVAGGVWTFAFELAEALNARGAEIWLVSFGGVPTIGQRRDAARITNLRFLWRDSKLEWMEDPWEDVEESGEWLLRLATGFRPDIVHLNSYGYGALRWPAPVVLTAHSCVRSWWDAVKGGTPGPEWDRYTRAVQRALNAADIVAAPSQAMADSVRKHYGIGNCLVIPNGRLPSRFRLGPKTPMILAAGRLWDDGKNIRPLLDVAPMLPWPVYLAGVDRNGNGQETFPNCTFLGHLPPERLALWYSRAPIFVSLARYEPFGLCALEAALSGCALVLSDIPSQREIWEDSAVFVTPGDAAGLERAVGELIIDRTRRDEFAGRAARRARSFPPDRTAAAYLEAYKQAAKGTYPCVS